MNTKRTYFISMTNDNGLETFTARLGEITMMGGSPSEYQYALHEVMDDLLDLRVGESMYFQPNRDSITSKGIIIRNK